MITFYKADETDFDNNGLGVLDHDIQNPDIEEKLNDIFTFSFNYPIFAVNGARLAARMIVKADDPENSGQLFRIMKLSKSNGMLTAFCYHIFYDLNGNEIPDTNIVGQNGQTAITQMLSKTAVAHKFQGFSDIAETANIRVVRMSPVKFLIDPQTDNNFINRLGGEIRRVNYRIWMNKVRGSDNGATIRWKKSLDSYNATWDYTTIATRIRPVGYNGIMLPESYVDSPLIDKYETIVIKEIQYSDIKAIDPNATSNDETAVPLEQAYELLRQAAAKEFSGNNLDKPTVTLSVNMVALRNMDEYKDVKSLETINPWDTVTVINERDGLSVKVRLNHYHWNPVTHKFISMELGNSKSTFTDIGSKVDHATNIANQANDTANSAAESANGKNSNYYGPSEPSRPVDGDLWYKKNGDKTELWQYDGKSVPPGWKLVVDDAKGEEVRQNVDAAQKEAEEAKKTANESVAAANDAVAKAGFANDTADQAKSDAAAAQKDATGALNSALDAQSDASIAVTQASSAAADSKDAKQIAGAVSQSYKTLTDGSTMTIAELEGGLAVKLTKDDLNGYATQTWAQNQISATADGINGTMSSIKSTVDGQTTSINDLKADSSSFKSQFTTVNDTLGKHTTDIGTLKATSKELSSGFNTLTTDNTTNKNDISQLKQTATEVSSTLETVQTQVQNSAVGTNLLKNTSDFSSNWRGLSSVSTTTEYNGNPSMVFAQSTQLLALQNLDLGKLQNSTKYTASFWAKADNAGDKAHTELWGSIGAPNFVLTTNWVRYTATVTSFSDANTNIDHSSCFFGVPTGNKGNVYIALPKLEKGSVATDWCPNPADNATVTAVSSISQTVEDMKFDVSKKIEQKDLNGYATQSWSQGQLSIAKNEITTSVQNMTSDMATQTWTQGKLDLTADGLTSQISSVQDGLDTKYTSFEQTLKGVQSTANNAVTQSQYTQLADQFTSVIGDLDNLIIGGDFEDQRAYIGKQSPYWSGFNTIADNIDKNQDTNKSNTVLQINGLVSGNQDVTSKNLVAIRQAEYNMSLKTKWHNPDQLGSIIIYAFEYDANKNLIAPKSIVIDRSTHGWKVITATYKPSSSAVKYMALDVTYNGAKSTLPVWIDDIQLGLATATQSQFTQLQNDINLRVQKGDVINQINISPESILIAGQKVHITGRTSIDNAVIKDAMIADIKADKITAGTLNAANVNVINLNANNITTGTLKGANLSMNLNTGEVLFQKGSIKSSDGTFAVDIDNRTITSTDNSHNGIVLKHGELLFYKGINAGSGSAEFGRMDVAFLNGGGLNITGYNGLTLGTEITGLYEANLALVSPKNSTSGKSIASLVGDVIYLQTSHGEINISGKTEIAGSVSVVGDFGVMGKKNAIHPTNDGIRETPAYETAESYLGDIGEGVTDESGRALIHIDDLFNQIINTDYGYQVFVSSYSNAIIWVEERNATSFEVHSNISNAKFAWELKAKRRGYETDRLVKSEMNYEQLNKFHKKKVSA